MLYFCKLLHYVTLNRRKNALISRAHQPRLIRRLIDEICNIDGPETTVTGNNKIRRYYYWLTNKTYKTRYNLQKL